MCRHGIACFSPRSKYSTSELDQRTSALFLGRFYWQNGRTTYNHLRLKGAEMTTNARSMLEEFKSFALKGNVIDLAIGVIIGAAFAKIVDSLVKHIIMPVIGLLLPSQSGYLSWKLAVGEKVIPYGLFIGEVVNFVVIALALYLFIVKFLGFVMRAKKEEAAAPPAPTKQEQLLTEIRDLLKAR
jgi:large conductance mechanosensitive channel